MTLPQGTEADEEGVADDDDDTTDVHVRKFGFQNTKQWFANGLNRFGIKVQQEFPIEYPLQIDTWTGVSNGNDQAELTENMRNYYETNKFHNMYVNTFNIALLIALIVSAGLAFVTLYSLVITVAAAGILAFRCIKAAKEYPKRVNAALEALGRTLAEISDFRQYFELNLYREAAARAAGGVSARQYLYERQPDRRLPRLFQHQLLLPRLQKLLRHLPVRLFGIKVTRFP